MGLLLRGGAKRRRGKRKDEKKGEGSPWSSASQKQIFWLRRVVGNIICDPVKQSWEYVKSVLEK